MTEPGMPESNVPPQALSETTGSPGVTQPPLASTAPATPGATLNYAGFGSRFVASIIDGIVLIIPGFLLGVVLGALGIEGVLNGVAFLASTLCYAYLESSPKQATFGKQVMKIKVTDENGQRLTLKQALMRNLAKFVSGFILGIGYLFVFFTPKKQTLHDQIAKCVVIKAE